MLLYSSRGTSFACFRTKLNRHTMQANILKDLALKLLQETKTRRRNKKQTTRSSEGVYRKPPGRPALAARSGGASHWRGAIARGSLLRTVSHPPAATAPTAGDRSRSGRRLELGTRPQLLELGKGTLPEAHVSCAVVHHARHREAQKSLASAGDDLNPQQ